MSGHSKWSTIKRAKGAADAKRGKVFTKLGREITLAARDGGGDPAANPSLRLAVQKARDQNMPVDNIERAIKRGTGESTAGALEEMTLEGYSPGGAAMLLKIVTDNRNRTVSEVRSIFTKNNASMGEVGCVTWIFQKEGIIAVEADGDTDEIELAAIDAGAEDVKVDDGIVEIHTKPEVLEAARKSLEESGISVSSAEVTLVPQNKANLDEKTGLQTLKLIDKLEDIDDVQQVFTNADFPDEALEIYQSG